MGYCVRSHGNDSNSFRSSQSHILEAFCLPSTLSRPDVSYMTSPPGYVRLQEQYRRESHASYDEMHFID